MIVGYRAERNDMIDKNKRIKNQIKKIRAFISIYYNFNETGMFKQFLKNKKNMQF